MKIMSILIVGEKPSVSRAISSVVGADKVQKGYTEGNGYIVSWCVGHLVGLKYPNGYGNGWEQKWSFSQLPMIPEKWLFKVTDSTKAQYNIIKDLMNRGDVTEIICATDADREGECIFRYVYNMARCRKPVKRLWVSSLEESAIRKALTNMKPMSAYDCLFDAGYARAKADWLVGMNGSRLFSVRYGGKLNIGRVQTPTLAMIVQRDHDVEHFVKQKYFTADLNCGDFILSSARIDDEANADNLIKKPIDNRLAFQYIHVCRNDKLRLFQIDESIIKLSKLLIYNSKDMIHLSCGIFIQPKLICFSKILHGFSNLIYACLCIAEAEKAISIVRIAVYSFLVILNCILISTK